MFGPAMQQPLGNVPLIVPPELARKRPRPNTMSPYEFVMRLIAHVAWLSLLSTPPQLGGPKPVGLPKLVPTIDPDVSRISTTYGLSGSPACAVAGASTESAATPSHAKSFVMRAPV